MNESDFVVVIKGIFGYYYFSSSSSSSNSSIISSITIVVRACVRVCVCVTHM